MKLIMEGSVQELKDLFGGSFDAQRLLDLMEKAKISVTEGNQAYSVDIEFLGSIAWRTFHQALVIAEKSGPGQEDNSGLWLEADSLEQYGIKEASASRRVGGSRKVCSRLNIQDVLFTRTVSGTKRFYLREDVKPALAQYLEIGNNDIEYKNFLSDEGVQDPRG